MHPIIQKTFGGLSTAYYFRHFVFGLIFPAFMIFIQSQSRVAASTSTSTSVTLYLVLAVNTVLYPYSRFVYESIVDFILGDNVIFGNLVFVLFVKLATMSLCWGFAIFVAPVGLLYLYYYHSKQRE